MKRIMIACLLGGGAASPVLAETAGSDSPSTIEWRVKDRFRLFNQASQGARDKVDVLLDRLAERSADPLSASYDAFLEVLSDHDATQGHAVSLRRSNYHPSGEEIGRHSGRYDPAYLYPSHYDIELRETGQSGRTCAYTSAIAKAEGPCNRWISVAVPPGDGRSLRAGANGVVSVMVDGAAAAKVDYAFADETIVALGDSFIAGEGNPDRPSLLRSDEPDSIFERPSWGSRVAYGKQLLRKAEWWDKPCHRSLLSWPVLSTLAHAARNPHRAVTLVHLGCSGAVIGDLTSHGETDLPGGGDETDGQLALIDGLMLRPDNAWSPRRIDKLLLSIGGNDIGFVGVLTTLTLPPNGFTLGPAAARLVGKEAAAICPYEQTGKPLSRLCDTRVSAEVRVATLKDGYARLGADLARRGVVPASVYQVLYPNPLIGEGGRPCDNVPENDEPPGLRTSSFGGFEALMGIFPKAARGPRFKSWRFELQYVPEKNLSTPLYPDKPWIKCDDVAEPDDSEVCQAMLVHSWLNAAVRKSGFSTISGHVAATDGHGLCVVGDGPDLSLPLASNGRWLEGKKPADFDPYIRAEKGRWFRVPNDSILTQFDIYDGAPRFHQGTVHPTYRAHLEYAQAALGEALEK